MAEFKPVSPPLYVYDVGGAAHTVFGWFSHDDEWMEIQPVIANPDGGVAPWRWIHGEDPWKVT